tara:strand:- start:86275 stop:86517 length:243 start_codon:yes stop_codon:yes gene_type:complete
MEGLKDIIQILIPIAVPLIMAYIGYLNGRIRQLEKDVKMLEVQTALNTKDGVTFEKYFDEFKADIKKEMQDIKDILNRKD